MTTSTNIVYRAKWKNIWIKCLVDARFKRPYSIAVQMLLPQISNVHSMNDDGKVVFVLLLDTIARCFYRGNRHVNIAVMAMDIHIHACETYPHSSSSGSNSSSQLSRFIQRFNGNAPMRTNVYECYRRQFKLSVQLKLTFWRKTVDEIYRHRHTRLGYLHCSY